MHTSRLPPDFPDFTELESLPNPWRRHPEGADRGRTITAFGNRFLLESRLLLELLFQEGETWQENQQRRRSERAYIFRHAGDAAPGAASVFD